MSNDPRRLRHGDLAIVRYTHGGNDQLAMYCDQDCNGQGAHWAFFGTAWTDSASQVTVVRRVQLAEVTA